ncbi:sensor histidine kinase [Shimia marina]|uniref:histidine kinase n=1 Tax=Shimia marina TaxID=321267 RepID=A0A0N7LSE2_9RHOB|nr:ATP-binding protein [Shimia marina]CUH53372.1 C4-dicarboxylate transport sensor protein DctB [Shimia marina]SFD78550.1 two-component system, NtrC family, C4-dicarboxylate transport sensor histidine kinase DctB [Shimia marina]
MARVSLTVSLLLTLCVGFAVNRAAFQYFSAEELAKAEGQLSLYRSTVIAELEQHSHLTHVLAQDSYVVDALAGQSTFVLNARLKDFSDKAGLDAIYLMTAEGITIAASNFDTPTSFVGQVYAFRPYFQNALRGEQGRLYAIGATTGLPGFFLADPVFAGADVRGVVALKKSFSGLEDSWRRAGEQVILANAQGVVLLASDPDWLYRTLTPLDAEQKAAIRAARQFPGQPLDPLSWQKTSPDRAEILGEERLHLLAQDLPDGWQLHYFASDEQAVTRSWLATAVVVVLAGILLIVFQVQRARRIGRALRRSEQEEAQLRQANAQLAVEVAERKTAEARLKSTQKELAQASRLAALGQLSASVTHELGQPIAAMRNHLAAAEMNPKGAERLGSNIAGLVTRMEGITRQLKFFATSGHEGFEVFELRAAVEAGLELVAPNIEAGEISVQCVWPQEVLRVRGNRLRIEQVVTNILRNACDAMEDMAQAELHIHVFAKENCAVFSVADTGHGLAGAALQDLQEPFVTTRESGRGMGLGLAISATIVKDHGGDMQAWDRRHEAQEGGAIFEVRLPLAGAGHGLDRM